MSKKVNKSSLSPSYICKGSAREKVQAIHVVGCAEVVCEHLNPPIHFEAGISSVRLYMPPFI